MKIESKANSTTNNKTGGWRTFQPMLNQDKCTGCSLCTQACPEDIIEIKNKKAEIDYDFCKGCGLCAQVCPAKCIQMELEDK